MNEEFLRSRFEMLLPLAATWATEQEQKIVRRRRPAVVGRPCRRPRTGIQEADKDLSRKEAAVKPRVHASHRKAGRAAQDLIARARQANPHAAVPAAPL